MSPQQQSAPRPRAAARELLPPQFRCTSSPGGLRAVWVDVCGELDLVTAPELERALREAAETSRLVVLDLHGLTFIDSSGLHVIEDASVRALLEGRMLVVSRAPAHVRRIVAASGTAGAIELLDADPRACATRGSLHLVR